MLQKTLVDCDKEARTRGKQKDSPEDSRKFLFTEDATFSGQYGRQQMSRFVWTCLVEGSDINTLIGHYLRKCLNLEYIRAINPELSKPFLSLILMWCLKETAPVCPTRAETSVSPLDPSKIEPLMRQLQQVSYSFDALVQDAIHLFDDKEWSNNFTFKAFTFACNFRKCQDRRLCMLAEYPQYLKLEKCCAHHTETKYLVKL